MAPRSASYTSYSSLIIDEDEMALLHYNWDQIRVNGRQELDWNAFEFEDQESVVELVPLETSFYEETTIIEAEHLEVSLDSSAVSKSAQQSNTFTSDEYAVAQESQAQQFLCNIAFYESICDETVIYHSPTTICQSDNSSVCIISGVQESVPGQTPPPWSDLNSGFCCLEDSTEEDPSYLLNSDLEIGFCENLCDSTFVLPSPERSFSSPVFEFGLRPRRFQS